MTGKNKQIIDQLWLFVSVDEDGHEGVCATKTEAGFLPMVASDIKRVEQLIPIAKEIAEQSGMPVRLLRFHAKEVVQTLGVNIDDGKAN